MISIQVPATSANMGSGFDSLGIALSLYNTVNMEEWDSIFIESTDNAPIPTDEHNLIYKTVKSVYDMCGKSLKGIHIQQTNNIPLARGLGSSSACIVSGIMGANKLLREPLSTQDIIDMAAKLEGHPDNSTPAILGGQVVSSMENNKVYYSKQVINNDLSFVAIIPDFELKTSDARAALPTKVDIKDATYNLSRAALMALSLATGNYQNIRVSCSDRLHQPYRLPLISGAREVIDYAYNLGAYGAYISGAGSTLMSIIKSDDLLFIEKMEQKIKAMNKENWKIVMLKPDNNGTVITEL